MGGSGIERETQGEGGIINADGIVEENTALFALLDGFPISAEAAPCSQ